MALRVRFLDQACGESRDSVTSHWHHSCWFCGRELCGGARVTLDDRSGWENSYVCQCYCGETEHSFIQTDKGYDREMAAALPCP